MNIVYMLILLTLTSSSLFCSFMNDESKSLKISSSQPNSTNTSRTKEMLDSLKQPRPVTNNQINELLNYINHNSEQQLLPLNPNILNMQEMIKAMAGKPVNLDRFYRFIHNFNSIILDSINKIIEKNVNDNVYDQFCLKHGKDINTFFDITHNIVRMYFIQNNILLSDKGVMYRLNDGFKIIYFFNEPSKSFVAGKFNLIPSQDYSHSSYYYTLTQGNGLYVKQFIMDRQERFVEETGVFIEKAFSDSVPVYQYFGQNSEYLFSRLWDKVCFNPVKNKETKSPTNQTFSSKTETLSGENNISIDKYIKEPRPKLKKSLDHSSIIPFELTKNENDNTEYNNYFNNYLERILKDESIGYSEFFPTPSTPREANAENYAFYYILNQESQEFSAIKKVINAINDFVNTNSADQIDTDSNNQIAVKKFSDLILSSNVTQTIQDQAAKCGRNYIAAVKQEFVEQSEQQQQLEKEWQQVRERVIFGGSNKNNKKSKCNKNKKPSVPNRPQSALASQTESQYVNSKLNELKQSKIVKVRKAMQLVNDFLKDNGVSETTRNLTMTVKGSHWTFHASDMSSFTLVMPHGNKKGFRGSVLTDFLSNIIKASNKN